MKTGTDLRGSSLAPRPRAERIQETADVPPALYTLRAIVLGVAGVIGIVGALAFVRVPDAVPGPAEAAAGLRPDGLVAGPDCVAPCLGRAAGVQEIDALPTGLDARALAGVTRVEPEAPLAATPPPQSARRSDAGHDNPTDSDEVETEKETEKEKGAKGGSDNKAEAERSPEETDEDD